jgi:hypothetical protein
MARVRDKLHPSPRYEGDFYSWALEQAALLRDGRLDLLDLENLAEEVESLGKREARELRSRCGTLLTHLLEWQFQPLQRSYGRSGTIRRERREIERHLLAKPGLKPLHQELFADIHPTARDDASAETDLPPETFPEACPYTLEQAMDPAFWPGGEDMPERGARGRRR